MWQESQTFRRAHETTTASAAGAAAPHVEIKMIAMRLVAIGAQHHVLNPLEGSRPAD
jgi:hypothetical protein